MQQRYKEEQWQSYAGLSMRLRRLGEKWRRRPGRKPRGREL